MASRFLDALRSQVLVFDGAMGTMLYAKGVFINRCFDSLNVMAPDKVAQVHRDYVRAGADVIETNTFGANRIKLRAFGLGDRVAVLTYSEFGRRAAENASVGTDHGAGSVALLAGAPVQGGLYGPMAELNKLDKQGDVPVALDFRPGSGAVPSAEDAAKLIGPRTRAIIPVDLYGNMADYDAIRAIASQHRIPIIEDAAEAVGGEYHGRPAGSLGGASSTSSASATPRPVPPAPNRPIPTSVPGAAMANAMAGKVGRNDPCPCGSGKKYKRCHGVNA